MHPDFVKFTDQLHPKFEALISMGPVTALHIPKGRPISGIYTFTEQGAVQYVGRTRNVLERYKQHTRAGSGQNSAPFAFKLARIATGFLRSDYRPGPTTRANLMQNPNFRGAFQEALQRIARMEFRYVEEPDPTRQCLLEVYVSVVTRSVYNDFDTH
jgi:hypothetical protein